MQFFGPSWLAKGSYFQSKTDKIDRHHHWILHIWIRFCIKFHFEQTILNFWTKFTQEKYWSSKTEKVNITSESWIFRLVLIPNSSLNWQFWYFWSDLPKRGFSGLKQKKWARLIFHIILHIQISVAQNFSWNWQCWFFGPSLPKKVFLVKNRKCEHHHWIPHIQINLGTKFQLKVTILIPLTRFTQKAFFWSKTEKVSTTYFLHNSAYSD